MESNIISNTKLIIVRHAETLHNREKADTFQGEYDCLSEKGKQQARQLANRLLQENIEVVYCSDFLRAKETLQPYLELCKVKTIYTPELREWDVGIFTGKKISEFLEWRNSPEGRIWYSQFNGKMDERFPKGESLNDLQKRVSKILEEIVNKERGKNILILTHGKTERSLLLHLLNKDYETHAKEFNLNNASISIIHLDCNGIYRAGILNDTSHLSEPST